MNTKIKTNKKILLEWKALEYQQYEKGKLWYLTAIGIGLGFIVGGIAMGNITMALAIIVFAGVYYYFQKSSKPKYIKIKITSFGVYVGEMFFPFGKIEAFWIIDQYKVRTLNLKIFNRFHTDVVIQLNKQDSGEVRDILIKKVPEWEGRSESFSDTILRIFKF